MKTYFSYKLYKLYIPIALSALLVSANTSLLLAQSKGRSDRQEQPYTDNKATDAAQSFADTLFVKKVSQNNLAQIELGELALEKAITEQVSEFAQVMIDHHTMFQTGLADIVIKHPAGAGNSLMNDANDLTPITSPDNDADKTATLGGTGGTTGNSMGKGMTNGEYNSNLPLDRDTLPAEVNSTPTARENVPYRAEKNRSTQPSASTAGTSGTSGQGDQKIYPLLTDPAPEAQALRDKLVRLSGVEFEKAYIEAMLRVHAEAIELYEQQARQTDTAKNNELISYASRNLPLIKKHYVMAKEIINAMNNR